LFSFHFQLFFKPNYKLAVHKSELLAAGSDKFIPASIIGDVIYWLLSVCVHVFTAT